MAGIQLQEGCRLWLVWVGGATSLAAAACPTQAQACLAELLVACPCVACRCSPAALLMSWAHPGGVPRLLGLTRALPPCSCCF